MSSARYALPLILFTVTTNAGAQILLKQGMSSLGPVQLNGEQGIGTIFRILFNPFVFTGLVMIVVSMASHLVVLSRVDLSFAYPFLSLAYIIVASYAFFVFGEAISPVRLAGYGLICAGTLLIAAS